MSGPKEHSVNKKVYFGTIGRAVIALIVMSLSLGIMVALNVDTDESVKTANTSEAPFQDTICAADTISSSQTTTGISTDAALATTSKTTEPAVTTTSKQKDKSTAESEEVEQQSSDIAKSKSGQIYFLTKGTVLLDDQLNVNYTLSKQGYFTGVEDEANKDYISIDFMFGTRLVKKGAAKQIDGAVALCTSTVSQRDGELSGDTACGPTAATIILNYDKGEHYNKDELIRYTEENGLADQGSIMSEEGGMTAPMILKLIESYSQGRYHAKNMYSDKVKPSVMLKEIIDSGKHSILSVRYAYGVVHHLNSVIHFICPCGYIMQEGQLYFYYADTTLNSDADLMMVSASEIDRSVAQVNTEPKCIIVLD